MIEKGQCYIVAEIGINHNGSLDLAKKLISSAKGAGCHAVKFQKRTIDIVFTPEELARPRPNPFGETNGDLKRGLEFGREEYDEIDAYCRELGIEWFASPWDEEAVEFLEKYDTPYIKVALASATDKDLLARCIATGKPLLVSTGMCDLAMIRKIVAAITGKGGEIACLYHCTSTYPAELEELNLRGIHTLQDEFPDIPIGYSGHEVSPLPTLMAVVQGARSVERHITLDRTTWGSDQAASLEIKAVQHLAAEIRAWERARGDGVIRFYDSEKPIAEKLRRKNTL